ncbi:MAG TPA: DegQ family serine endoprotease [Candidatus Limnocylindrales bacterium]|nr:DegQ family serine endoprotease [Candidatus Limnocylindrales bacterium]
MSFNNIWRRPKAAALAMVMALGLGGLAVEGAEHLGIINPPASLHFAPADEPVSHNTFAPVVKRVLPAVVNISSTKMLKTSFQGSDDPMDNPLFRQFFGDNGGGGRQFRVPRQQQQKEQGLGSGVIVSPEGYILTNNHVVDGATDVRVTLSDRREFKARVVGTDPKTDVAVVKIDANNLTPIVIGDSGRIQVGDYVLAVGDPFGVGKTVTMGIVSATGRGGLGIEDYEDFIQTDASINPGNSGGALVNDRGELIGINTAILAHGSEGNQGIGFAIPVSVARRVMDQIIKNGKVTRAYLGVMAQEVTPAIAKAFNEPEVRGALVGDVTPDSPASRAGIQKGDIILGLNGQPVDSAAQLRMNVSLMQPGSSVNVKVLRNGAAKDFNVHLEELPVETAKANGPDNSPQESMQGIQVENVNARDARQLGIPANTPGVVVTGIDPNSAAADSGLQEGDVIMEVNRKPVNNAQEFEHAVRNSKDQALLLVNRQGQTMYITV